MASIPPTNNTQTTNTISEQKKLGGGTSIFTPLFNGIS